MKKIVFIFISIVFSLALFAQDDAPEAVSMLNKVAEKMESYNTLKLEFNFFIEDLHEGSRDGYSGNALYKDGYYRLELMGQIVFSDGHTNWTYLMDADEVNIVDNVDEEDNIVDPRNILNDFEEEYKVRFISDKFERNRPLVEIDLYPVDIDEKNYSRITLRVDKVQHQIYSVRYVGKDGVSYLIEIYQFIENPQIAESDIKFSDDLFPGAEIIDMRY